MILKKKNLIIFISIICPIILLVIGAVIFIGSLVIMDFKQENKLRREFDDARTLINEMDASYDDIDEILGRTITKGDYKILEISYKEYLYDIYNSIQDVKNTLFDDITAKVLNVENCEKDGPEFKDTKRYINKLKSELQNSKEEYNELFTKEKIMSYINNKGLDDYYIDIYKEEVEKQSFDEEVIVSVDKLLISLENLENVINFLVENKNSWKIDGKQMYFYSDGPTNTFYELLDKISQDNKSVIYTKSFGTYRVPNSFIESKSHSTSTKFFYCLKGYENDLRANNISINEDINKYSKDEHVKFRMAIMKQLSSQIGNRSDVTINANGSTTNNGYIVYRFVIYESIDNITTTQYYIIGDYKYILVHETVFGGDSTKIDNATLEIVNSFKWE